MKTKLNQKWANALTSSIPYILVLCIIGIALYLHALIIQDYISGVQAEIYGYIALAFLVAIIIGLIIMINMKEQDLKEKDEEVEALEKELERIKKKNSFPR